MFMCTTDTKSGWKKIAEIATDYISISYNVM